MQDSIDTEFVREALLKESQRGQIVLLRHRFSGTRYIFRSFRGSGQVYRKLLTLRCSNLPQIMEVAEEDGQVLVLEEYIQGDNLAEMLRGGLFTEAETRPIVRQLCAALWVLHSLGAVHRDVKPENVILRGGEAVLIDFDAARFTREGVSADTMILGTTGYAPPEQYGLSQTDPRSDIYALGVLLNVMLTGEHPSRTLAPGRMGRIVRKCTMMNPDQRYRSVLALMEDI